MTRVFYVQDEGIDVRVCKKAFLRIHAVSNGRLNRALQARLAEKGSVHMDLRGRHTPANKTKPEDILRVKEHIDSFPRCSSHYSRSDNPHRQYLSSDLSRAKMYSLYKVWCSEKSYPPVGEWVYRKIFNENYNLSFGR